jgi:hypothetical protein
VSRKLALVSVSSGEYLYTLWVFELFKVSAIPNLLTVFTVLIFWLVESPRLLLFLLLLLLLLLILQFSFHSVTVVLTLVQTKQT